MSDEELLKLAAKAAGVKIDYSKTNGGGMHNTGFDVLGNAVLDWHNGERWNPLKDDSNAFRLAVKLNIFQDAYFSPQIATEAIKNGGDWISATRRAIVVLAAKIGEPS